MESAERPRGAARDRCRMPRMRLSISILARLLATASLLGACAGDSPDPITRRCTRALYEFCLTEHDCMEGDCRDFMGEGYKICTKGCTADVPCPDLNGTKVTCNNMNVCKPPEPIECEVVPSDP
jgi:hypothetical protein